MSTDGTGPSTAGCHGPSSTRTSTLPIPRCCAQATPATVTVPARGRAPSRGVSIRDSVLIGACCAQPRGIQYALKSAKLVSSSSVSHFVADTYPYSPGTTTRTGNPCSTGSGSPFIPTAISASRPSMSSSVGVPTVNPSADRPTT